MPRTGLLNCLREHERSSKFTQNPALFHRASVQNPSTKVTEKERLLPVSVTGIKSLIFHSPQLEQSYRS